MPPSLRRDLERRAAPVGARVRDVVSDPLSYVEAADVVVAMAGYSSTVEAVRSGTPTVLVPRHGPSAEQRMRTSRFADRGWVSAVDPDDLNGASIAAAVLERLGRQTTPRAPEPDGLSTTVRRLASLLIRGTRGSRDLQQPEPAAVAAV
jgi:predicted glycosyltransferase